MPASPTSRSVVALVPMRHESERVPGKNYRSLAGRPLYEHIIGTLLECPAVAEVVIDTDSPVIRAGCERNFPMVRVIDRPGHLRAGEVPMNDVIRNDIEHMERISGLEGPGYFLQTHSTNPLLRSETISRAIRTFFRNVPEHDSLFSVTRRQTRLYDAAGRPLNHDPEVLLRTQDLPPVYEENSNLYIFSRDGFLSRNNRVGERPLLFEIDRLEALDIDDEEDFTLVEALCAARRDRAEVCSSAGSAPLAHRG